MAQSKQQKTQTKREKKAAKEAARAAAAEAERRRNLITAAVIAGIVVAAGGLAGWTVWQDRQEQAALEAEREAEEERREEAAAELEAEIDERPVACGASEPEGAGQEREPYEEAPDLEVEEGASYTAEIETSCGRLTVDLREDAAPETVASFAFLAEEGFFDGLEVFRNAETIGALQTGSGTNAADWDLGYEVPGDLALAEEEGYPVGSVAMAHAGDPDAAGSQFFFVYDESFDEAFADNRVYTRFGDVVDGLDVLTEIAEIGTIGDDPALPGAEVPAEVVYLESVSVELER